MSSAPLGDAYAAVLPEELAAITPEISAPDASPGSIVHIAPKQGPVVQTGDGLLLLQSLQMAGKRRQSGWDFANGFRLSAGERLGETAA